MATLTTYSVFLCLHLKNELRAVESSGKINNSSQTHLSGVTLLKILIIKFSAIKQKLPWL